MELLTGKCKEDFESWYKNEFKKNWLRMSTFSKFKSLDLRMQWGIYKEFFNSRKIVLNVTTDCHENGDIIGYWGLVNHIMIYNDDGVFDFDDIDYTMELLIKWGNKLYNERHLRNIEVEYKEIIK